MRKKAIEIHKKVYFRKYLPLMFEGRDYRLEDFKFLQFDRAAGLPDGSYARDVYG